MSAPASLARSQADRIFTALPARSPTVQLICAMAILIALLPVDAMLEYYTSAPVRPAPARLAGTSRARPYNFPMPQIRILKSLADVDPQAWNSLSDNASARNPFLRHEFLHALETTGCV